jgi:hypothetical protein
MGQASLHQFLFIYNGQWDVHAPSSVRYGDYKAHFVTLPGIAGRVVPQCLPTDRNCTTIVHNPPLLFNVNRE